MDPFKIGSIGAIGGGGAGLSPLGFTGGLAGTRSVAGVSGMPPMSMEPLLQMNQQQEKMTLQMLKILFELMKNSKGGQGGGGDAGAGAGGAAGGVGGGGGGYTSGQPGDIINTGGGGATGGGGGGVTDSGPVVPGTDGLLEHANRMVGLNENSDTAAIQAVTGKSGINPASTPWCAAWAMNLLEQHGVMDLSGLSNRNYCPTIKSWSQGKGTWGENGSYTPKAGDAILFDWNKDGTSDHIGIVEKVAGGKVYTIEGNSSDSVKKNSYALGSGDIDGYVKSNGKGQKT